MKPTARYITIAILISTFSNVVAQKISSLDYNHAIKKQLIEKTQSEKIFFKSTHSYTPTLPPGNLFFDDFSTYQNSVFPDPNRWEDKRYAFVNQTFPDSCVSLGVATLDAVDNLGNIYSTNDKLTPSDTLTSVEIRLDTVTNNVFLSFFLQGGGKGDFPETNDSLIVEFERFDTAWVKVWATTGYESHNFKQIIIPIAPEFNSSGFQFRFRNYTSLVKDNVPGESEGALGNRDFWHIDYVQVKIAQDSNSMKAINDVAIVKPLESTYMEYNLIPYDHFEVATSYRRPDCPLSFRTYFPNITEPIKITRQYNSWNFDKNIFYETISNQNDENTMAWLDWFDEFNSAYEYYPELSYGHYVIQAIITPDQIQNQYTYNDTVTREEIFKNYYAHDDGTAEYGYGLPANGAVGMRLATMFNLYTFRSQDTLTAVDIYFPQSRNNAHGNVEFTVCIWDSETDEFDNIVPGELLYPKGNKENWTMYFPDTNLSINEFMRIKLTEELLVSDTIFVGLVQYGTEFINIGFDMNTNSKSRIRYFEDNRWITPVNSIPDGSLMIRPVFDHDVYTGIRDIQNAVKGNLVVYPNPAFGSITVEPENFYGGYDEFEFSIINVLGQTVLQNNKLENQIDISFLQSGMYIVRVVHVPTKTIFIQKFLKTE